jgi:hypothetical protein
MTYFYYKSNPIFSLFNIKTELTEYLLTYPNSIINDDIYINNDEDNWESSLKNALLRLGEYMENSNSETTKSISNNNPIA